MQISSPKGESLPARGTEKNCLDCNKKFSIVAREHQCKRCLKAVCSECGNNRKEVYSASFTLRDNRVCKSCKQSSSFISNYISSQGVRFGEMSDLGRKWLKKIINKPSTFGTDTSQHKALTRQYFSELWASYSFEMRELIGILTFKIQQTGVYEVVSLVYATVISAAPQYNISQIIYLVVYILCFCSYDKAPFIVLSLLELKPSQQQLKQLVSKYLNALPFKNELSKLQPYIQYRLDKYADSIFVNCITIECSTALITKILQKRSTEQLFMLFASHLFLNREVLVAKFAEGNAVLDNLMLRKCTPEQLTSNYKYFKGKNLSLSEDNSENYQQVGLRKMKTLNFERDLSPKERSQASPQSKPNLVTRDSAEYKQSFNDSFSVYIEAGEESSLKLSPQSRPKENSNILLEQFQLSPKSKSKEANQDMFRKAIQEEFDEGDLPPMQKPIRKYTQAPDNQNLPQKECQKCIRSKFQVESTLNKWNQDKLKWTQEKQSIQISLQSSNQKLQLCFKQSTSLKNKIAQIQEQYSQAQSRINIFQEQSRLNDQSLSRLTQQNSVLSKKAADQANHNLKLQAMLEQQRKNLKQARELCIRTGKQLEQQKQKAKGYDESYNSFQKKEAELKVTIDSQKEQISNLKATVADLQSKHSISSNGFAQELQVIKTESAARDTRFNLLLEERNRLIQEKENQVRNLTAKLNQILAEKNLEEERLKERTESLGRKVWEQKAQLEKEHQMLVSLALASEQKEKEKEQQIKSKQTQILQLQSLLQQQRQMNQERMEQLSTFKKQNTDLQSQNAALTQELNFNLSTQKNSTSQRLELEVQRSQEQRHKISSLQQELRQREGKMQQRQALLDSQISLLAQKEEVLGKIRQENQRLKEELGLLQQQYAERAEGERRERELRQQAEKLYFDFKERGGGQQQGAVPNGQLRQTLGELQFEVAKLKDDNSLLGQKMLSLQEQQQRMQEQLECSRKALVLLQKEKEEEKGKYDLREGEFKRLEDNSRREDLRIVKLEETVQSYRIKNEQLIAKLGNISSLMMEIEGEKMELADELFQVYQIMKAKGITMIIK